MADEAQVDIIMNGVDNGAKSMIDGVNSGLGETVSATDAAAGGTDKLSSAFMAGGNALTEFNSGVMIGKEALQLSQQAYDGTIGKALAYAETIRDLSAISGQGAEDTSRFVQVLDDFQIGASDIETAMRKMTENGLVPNFETIQKLAKEYQAIEDPLAKNEFLTKNLGRASAGYTNLLSQNTDELKRNFDSVNANLILSEKQLQQAEQLRLAQDQLNDTFEGLSITVGTKGVPAMATWATVVDRAISGTLEQRNSTLNYLGPFGMLVNLTQTYGDVHNELQAKLEGSTAAHGQNAEATKAETDALNAAAAAASTYYTSYLSNLDSLQAKEDGYTQKHAELAAQRAEIDAQMAATPAWDTAKIDGFKARLEEIKGSEAELAAKRQEDSARFVLQKTQEILAADGLSKAEALALIEMGENAGLYEKGTKEKLDIALKAAEELAKQTKSKEEEMARNEAEILAQRGETYQRYADSVGEQSEAISGDVQSVIDMFREVPTEINTNWTIHRTVIDTPPPTDESNSLSGNGASIVYNIYGPVSIGADHGIMRVVG